MSALGDALMFRVTCTMKTWSRGNFPKIVLASSSIRTLSLRKSRCMNGCPAPNFAFDFLTGETSAGARSNQIVTMPPLFEGRYNTVENT